MEVEVHLPDDPNESSKVEPEILYGLLEVCHPVRFTEEMIGLDVGEDLGHVYDWCAAAFGPSAIEFPSDKKGEPTIGDPSFVRGRPWAMYLGTVYCHDGATAAAFKLRWWGEKAETP